MLGANVKVNKAKHRISKTMDASGVKGKILRRTFWLFVTLLIGINAASPPLLVAAKPFTADNAPKTKASRPKRPPSDPKAGLGSDQITKVADIRPDKTPKIVAEPDPKTPFAYKADLGGAVARFQERPTRRAGVQLSGGDATLGFFLRDSTGSTSIKTGTDRVDFVKGDTSVNYTTAGRRIKEEIVLKTKPEKSTWTFDYYESGVSREPAAGGGWLYMDEDGSEVFRVLPATVKDAKGAKGGASMAINDGTLTLNVDPDFLQRAAYPVVIDPTVVTATTAASATRYPTNRKLLKTTGGALFLLYQEGGGLEYRVSTDTGGTWSAPTPISTTTRFEASVVIDSNDNIYAAYSDNTAANTVAFRKLTYAGNDSWTAGAETIVTTEAGRRFPSINRETGGRIWVSYRFNGTNTYARYSDDDGANWSASTDLGTTHGAGSSVLVPYQGYTAIIFEPNTTSLAWRYWDGAAWSAAQNIMTGTNIEDYTFSAVVTKNNYVHVAYAEGSGNPLFIRHTYYDGASWSAPVNLTTNVGDQRPQLTTNGRDIWAFWSQRIGLRQYKLVYKKNNGISWDPAPTVFTPSSERQFEQVWTRNGFPWTDETVDASNTVAGDVPLFNNNGSSLYAGQSEKFDYIYFDLSTNASANILPTWEYWNGSAWAALTITENPTYNFRGDGNIRFTPPADWAPNSVNGSPAYYFIRATRTAVVVATRPVATQFTAVKFNTYAMTILKDLEIAGVAWSEGWNPNYNVLFQPFAVSTITLTIDSTYNRDGTLGANSSDFGSVPPYDSPFMIHADAGKHAVQLTVASDVYWNLLVESAGDLDAGGGKTMPISQLSWRTHATAEPWTPFSTAPAAVLSDQAPTAAGSFQYDFQLATTWDDDPGTYLTTVTYTALPAP